MEASAFSKPYNNWHLSDEDEKLIDKLEEKILLNNRKKIPYDFKSHKYGSFFIHD